MTKRIGPQGGPQSVFLESPADIAIYGGAAGGGKSFALLLECLRNVRTKNFGAVIFRKSFPQITMTGGLWDEAEKIFPMVGGIGLRYRMEFLFPSGAKVTFAHMATDQDRTKYDGAQIPLIGFDQLEHFTERQWWYMLSRNRSTCGVTPYIRATCNPSPDSWLARMLSWWIDQETGYFIPERSGIVRWFMKTGDDLIWGRSENELIKKYPGSLPKSFTFIGASVYDNKILLSENPEYLSNLNALPFVEKERLLRGNWKIKPAAGNLYNRAWFEIVPAAPAGGTLCRFWDFAATQKKQAKDDPDFTAGVMIRFVNGIYYVEHCLAFQESPVKTDQIFYNQISQDVAYAKRTGARLLIRWEQEGGSAGIRESARLMQEISKRVKAANCKGCHPTQDKILRAKPFSSQANGGNIKVVEGDWNEVWLNHMHNQPDLPHDDICDGTTGAFNELGQTGWARGAG